MTPLKNKIKLDLHFPDNNVSSSYFIQMNVIGLYIGLGGRGWGWGWRKQMASESRQTQNAWKLPAITLSRDYVDDQWRLSQRLLSRLPENSKYISLAECYAERPPYLPEQVWVSMSASVWVNERVSNTEAQKCWQKNLCQRALCSCLSVC